jgi:hypothetical protein
VRPAPATRLPLLLLLVAALPALAGAAPPDAARSGAVVRLGDQRVLTLRAGRAGESAAERARAATQALARAVEEAPQATASVEVRGDTAAILVGRVTVLELGPEDVAASGAIGLPELAQTQASRIDRALGQERRRAGISEIVFEISLLVFSGLVVFLLIRKIGDLDRAVEERIRARRGGIPAVRLRGVELVSREGVASALALALRFLRYGLQVVLGYGWLVFALSLFAFTRGAGVQLGRFVVTPTLSLAARVGGALPAVFGALVAAAALWLASRAVRLFSGSVARGETHLSWLPADLAVPVGDLVRLALVVAALVFAAPVLTGTDQGALAQLGTAAAVALGLGAAPALASIAAGLPRVLRRTYRRGQVAEIGRTSGVVQSVDLLDVELLDATGRRVLVPHLATLVVPTRLPGLAAAARFELWVDPAEDQARVRELLLHTGGPGTAVDLVSLAAQGARYRVAGPGEDLAVRSASALAAAGIRLGRGPSGGTGDA